MRIRHQLTIHLDYHPTHGAFEIHYSYPFAGEHSIPEQIIRMSSDDLMPSLRENLDLLAQKMMRRIPVREAIRLPHAEVKPNISYGFLTLVVQDQKRADKVPLARLYYHEEMKLINCRVEKKVYIERPAFSQEELRLAEEIKKDVRKMAWEDYSEKMGSWLKSD